LLRGLDENGKWKLENGKSWREKRRGRFNTEDTEVGAQRARRRKTRECGLRRGVLGLVHLKVDATGSWVGNIAEDGLVRGAEFVMIWTFLVSRRRSAHACL